MMKIEMKEIALDNFESAINAMDGKRLITITCIERGDIYELIYHFDSKNVTNIMIKVKKGAKIYDISRKFPESKIYEQEIQENYEIDFGLPKKKIFNAEVD